MKIALGSDHAGFALKERLKRVLIRPGVEVEDMGTFSPDNVDYPDYARMVGEAVRDGKAERGVLVCSTGIGVCIAANKIPGIRAAAPWSRETTRLSRAHNDTNVLCLSSHNMEPALTEELLEIWLETPFDGGRHQRRIDKISAMEEHT